MFMKKSDSTCPAVSWLPSGVVVFWVSLFAITVGTFTYSGVAVILGILGLLILWLARWLAGRQVCQLELERLLPKRVFPGESFEIETRLLNRRSLIASRDLQLTDKLAGLGGRRINVSHVPPKRSVLMTYPAKVFQRGRIRSSQFELYSRWPFGFFQSRSSGRFVATRGGDDVILVAPKPLVPGYLDRIMQRIEQEAVLFSDLIPDSPTEFRALREFRPGDPVKSIHWPASSRSGSVIVRENDPPSPKPCCHGIFLHQYVPGGELNQPDKFERMLRIACGLLIRFWQRNLPVIVRLELANRKVFQVPTQDSYHTVLDSLAEAVSCPRGSLDHLGEGWELFEPCDQVFVLGDWDQQQWQSEIDGKHPSIVCIDPHICVVKKRTPRVGPIRGKLLTP